jgi:hypothetical protein
MGLFKGNNFYEPVVKGFFKPTQRLGFLMLHLMR